ncbi:unnamed protein product [Rodentolepis nana]|uniref:glucose-6-phosphatase n=1 Tax=Rodentolepis nana TaxID=102285 RepID=A0A0R3T459_RODNA|nr:unnamed protein product [Rodentolepis nana]
MPKVLDEDRPYWWVHTNGKEHIKLKQFPLTCEVGPGSPSGHCMVMISGWLPLLLYIRRKYNRLGFILLSSFITCIVLVAISRMYIATHFPHQTILGSIAGAVIGLFFHELLMTPHIMCSKSNKKIIRFHSSFLNSPSVLIAIGVLSLITGKAFGALLNYLGKDVERSYQLAIKYCARSEWLHPSTSAMASYSRVTGALIGLAGALYLHPLSASTSTPVVTSLREFILSCTATFSGYYVSHKALLFVSPCMKSFVKPITFISDISHLIYMAVLSALFPILVAFVHSTLHCKFFAKFDKQSTSPKPRTEKSIMIDNDEAISIRCRR